MAENYQYFPQYLDEWFLHNDYGLPFQNPTNPHWLRLSFDRKYCIYIHTWYFRAVLISTYLLKGNYGVTKWGDKWKKVPLFSWNYTFLPNSIYAVKYWSSKVVSLKKSNLELRSHTYTHMQKVSVSSPFVITEMSQVFRHCTVHLGIRWDRNVIWNIFQTPTPLYSF